MTAAITIHFKRPELTAGCIDSLLADGWTPIIVWDNSADGGVSLRPLEERYANNNHVQIVCNSNNLGFGKGMNAAMALLGGQQGAGPVLLVNNDARIRRGMKAALHEPLRDSNVPTLVAPQIEQDGQVQGWLYYHPWFALVTRRNLPESFAYLSGCCLLVSRPDNSQPLFDEDFFMYGEDVELSWRWRRQGGRLVLLEQAYLEHIGSASSGQASKIYERNLVQSHWMLAEKIGSNAFSITLMRVFRMPVLFVRACVRSLRFRSLVPLRVFINFYNKSGMDD